MAKAPGGFGSSHAVTEAALEEGVLYGKRGLLGSQAHCGHAPGTVGSHQSQETLRSPGWLPPPLVYLQDSQGTTMNESKQEMEEKTKHLTPPNTYKCLRLYGVPVL